MSNEKNTSDNNQGHAPLAGVMVSFCECEGMYSWIELEENLCWLCQKPIKNRDEIMKDYENGNFSAYRE